MCMITLTMRLWGVRAREYVHDHGVGRAWWGGVRRSVCMITSMGGGVSVTLNAEDAEGPRGSLRTGLPWSCTACARG
ncbi:hypothetical protein ABH927_003289 [Planotetraspora sp. GP83]